MKYTEFIEEVRNEVEKLCPFDKVVIEKIIKNNSTEYYGLIIKKEGVNVSPTIYLDSYYEKYTCGYSIENIVNEIVETDIRSRDEFDIEVDSYRDYDKMKDRLLYKIINTECNSEILRKVPHREYHDLSIVYYCLVPDSLGCVATWTVSNEIMKVWGVDEEILFEKATENGRRIMPYSIMSITDVICDLLTSKDESKEGMIEDLIEMEHGPQMYVATNKNKVFGAAVIIYPDVLIGFARKNGDFYVLPSSIHEVIFIPASENIAEKELMNMVKEVNDTQVPKDEFLSNEVYFFDAKENKLRKLNK